MFLKYRVLKILINIYFLSFFIYTEFNPLFLICKLILDSNYVMLFFFSILLSGIVRKIGSIIGFILNNFIYTVISVVNINNSKIIIVRSTTAAIIAIIITTFFFINL